MSTTPRSFRFPEPVLALARQGAAARGESLTAYLAHLIEAAPGLRAENAALKAMLGCPPDAVVLTPVVQPPGTAEVPQSAVPSLAVHAGTTEVPPELSEVPSDEVHGRGTEPVGTS
jgi:hypothetical protein